MKKTLASAFATLLLTAAAALPVAEAKGVTTVSL